MTQRRVAENAEVAEDPNRLSESIIGAAVEVHRHLGPGLLESAYEECLCWELTLRGLEFRRQSSLDVTYKGVVIRGAFRIDLVVADLILVELKAVEVLSEIHLVQLFTCLRLAQKPLGLVINFNTRLQWRGVRRVVNNI